MDPKEFDRLVARIFAERDRRAAVKGLLAGAAVAAVPALAEAEKHKGKGKAKAEGKDKKGKSQVGAERNRKKNFCLCRGTSRAQCNSATCVNCEYQEQIGKNKRKRIKRDFPFSFKVEVPSECPTTTTAPPTTTTTTTTRRPCGGTCNVGTDTCGEAGDNCVCRGNSVIPGSPGVCSNQPVTCSGQTCTSGAPNQCAALGASCVCNSDGPPGSPGTCGLPTTTTTPPPPNTCPGGSCTLDSCDAGCACREGFCVECVAEGAACVVGDVCCQTGSGCFGDICQPPPPNTCPGGSCTLGSCNTGCACVGAVCVTCTPAGPCTTGQICCNTAAACPVIGGSEMGVCP